MSKAPRITGQESIRALAAMGIVLERRRGSHCFLRHADGRRTVAPVHAGETIGPGLLNKILRDCRVSRDRLEKLL